MPVMDQVQLNQGQQAAADGFFQFLFSADKYLNLSGPGGVGKTFLMGRLIDSVMPQYFETCKLMGINPEFEDVVMTATTNKASEVLGLSTGRPTQTIHSFLNLTVKEDFGAGHSRLTRTRGWVVHERKIIFIDECSMIDSPLLQMLDEATHKCKIVFVGDHCQLAPVMESISPIYRMGLPFFELTEPMRNAGQPALMKICQQLRNTVETGEFLPIQIVPGIIDWVNDEEMERMIADSFRQQTRESRILSYTNKRVLEYNDHIRGNRNLPAEYGVDEILVNNQAIRLGHEQRGQMLSVEEEVTITQQAPNTIFIEMDEAGSGGVKLEIRPSTIVSRLGRTFYDVPIPVDRHHYLELVKYYVRAKNWHRVNLLKNKVVDLRPRDAATVHKAQGSTYDTVFIDVGNLSTCHLPNMVARLLYVAFTRARNRVILYGELSEKYGGLIE